MRYHGSMGRPRKAQTELLPPTRERIRIAAIDLFSVRGFGGVSVRQIARAVGLNEASLYNHYADKESLLAAILEQFESELLEPGLPDPRDLPLDTAQPLADVLIEDSKRFFALARQPHMRKTWRIILLEQYRDRRVGEFAQRNLLDRPTAYFLSLLAVLQERGKVAGAVDLNSAAACLGSIYFQYSFRSNLNEAHEKPNTAVQESLYRQVALFAAAIEVKGRTSG